MTILEFSISMGIIFIAHFIADFMCQTDEMAKGKSSSWSWLTMHITAYSLVIVIPVFLLFAYFEIDFKYAFVYVAINAVAHFITDALTSRWTTYLWKKEDRHNFFVVIGLDQLIHTLTLLFAFTWMVT